MLLLRLVWGWYVKAQLHRQIDAIHARGEPLEWSKFVAHRPDSENAVLLYRQAVNSMVPGVDSPRNSNLEYLDFFPPSPPVDQTSEASEKAFTRLSSSRRAARQRPRGSICHNMIEDAMLPYLSELKISLAQFVMARVCPSARQRYGSD
jgi:hypothetical protein